MLEQNKILIMKFGGASVKDSDHFKKIASIIAHRKLEFSRIVVVVSAMGNMTDLLVELGYKVHKSPPRREFDMLVSAGERLSIALLSMALDSIGIDAISFTGSQSGIITSNEHAKAKIINVRPSRIISSLDQNKVVVVAGFQGVSLDKEVTTLGRGGSDTTAVALAVGLRAEKVEFYKDVKGICEKDPKIYPEAKILSSISYDRAIDLAEEGGVLHPRSLKLAKTNGILLHLLSFNEYFEDSVDNLGTKIWEKNRACAPEYEEGVTVV